MAWRANLASTVSGQWYLLGSLQSVDTSPPRATFVLIVVLNKTGTKLTKKPSAGKNNQNQLLRDTGMTPQLTATNPAN